MKQESGGFVYRVPLGRGYEVSILSTAYSYGGREGLYEIALVDADGEPVNIRGQVKGFEGDEVLGWLTERQVREYIKVLGDFVWHHKGLDAEQIKRQLWTENGWAVMPGARLSRRCTSGSGRLLKTTRQSFF